MFPLRAPHATPLGPVAPPVPHTDAMQVIMARPRRGPAVAPYARPMPAAVAAMVQLLYAIRGIIKAALPVRAVRHRAECTARPSPREQRP